MPFVQTAAHPCRPAMGLCLTSMPASWTHGHLHELWPRESLLRLQHSELNPPHTRGHAVPQKAGPEHAVDRALVPMDAMPGRRGGWGRGRGNCGRDAMALLAASRHSLLLVQPPRCPAEAPSSVPQSPQAGVPANWVNST